MVRNKFTTAHLDSVTKPGWRTVKFGEMAENIGDRVDNPSEAGVERYVGLEHLDPESLAIRRWGTPDQVEATKLRFKPGDIIFGKRRAYQRKLAVADFEGICSAHAMVLRAREETVVSDFLPVFMQSDIFFERALAISVGSLSPTINWKTLAAQEFLVPPKEEQRRIAEILWATDSATLAFQDCLATQFKVKKSLSIEFFDGGTETTTSLGEIGTWMSGGTPDRSNGSFWNGAIPWASPKDMKVDQLLDTEEHVSEKAVGIRLKLVPVGTIFVVVRGMILAHTFPVAVTGKLMAFNQDIKALTVFPQFCAKYVFYWLGHMGQSILGITSESSHGTKRLPTEQLFKFQIPKLPLKKQQQIAEVLSKCDGCIRDIRSHMLVLEEVKKVLIAELLGV